MLASKTLAVTAGEEIGSSLEASVGSKLEARGRGWREVEGRWRYIG